MADNNRPNNRLVLDRPAAREDFVFDPKIVDAITGSEQTNIFPVDDSLIPPNMEYEGKRFSTMGQEDKQYQAQLRRLGWLPVPSARHPEIGTEDPTGINILIKGLILMERHVKYNELSRQAIKDRSAYQDKSNIEKLGGPVDGANADEDAPNHVKKFRQTIE